MSTSRSVAQAEKFHNLTAGWTIEINAPKGAKAVDFERLARVSHEEREVLFARGTKLKVLSFSSKTRRIKAMVDGVEKTEVPLISKDAVKVDKVVDTATKPDPSRFAWDDEDIDYLVVIRGDGELLVDGDEDLEG